ncbi:hypothetical protein I316_04009 [Kwoniella heveanensis BCC8398]|uniref:BCAS3 WD40 domain-containing protein n=1 Tax=Kwoniella heveanensis BCC8398 TaxID=1296120 RepID=A0A1B9GTU6_9TREE|nr:hypothetical protein I316_04009 [Kwoniella heveanensis BCC8398]
MSSLKGFLPTSPTKLPSSILDPAHKTASNDVSAEPGVVAVWQEHDLRDGRGKVPLLLVSGKTHALQVFTFYESTIPDDPHIPESFSAPEEVISLPSIQYDKATIRENLEGVATPVPERNGVRESILSMRLLDRGSQGPLVAMTTHTSSSRKSALGSLAMLVVDLKTGIVVRRLELGPGSAAEVHCSPRAIVVTISHPSPSIHLLHPSTYEPLPLAPFTSLPCNPRTTLPVISLSGRLLAFATSDAPHAPGADGLGSIITASSFRTSRSASSSSERSQRPASSGNDTSQAALLNSAVEIGGGVARGVWAGLKMGAKAANRARNTRLATSAPTDSSSLLGDGDSDGAVDSEARSLNESSVLEEQVVPAAVSGEWIQIIDIVPGASAGARRKRKPTRSYSTSRRAPIDAPDEQDNDQPTYEVIAHFRLPRSSALPLDTPHASRRRSNERIHPVAHLSFSPDGTQLLAAPSDGKSFHVVEVHPAGINKNELRGEVKGQVWHLYELRRGHTAASVRQVNWDQKGRWVGVGTGKGTVHVFPISAMGGPASSSTHATANPLNPTRLHTLSTVVAPIARLRPLRSAGDSSSDLTSLPTAHCDAAFIFGRHQKHPLHQSMYCQDVIVYRTSSSVLEVARISVEPVSHSDRSTETKERRGSALTEMMRNKAFGDLSSDSGIKAAWTLPPATDDGILWIMSDRSGNIKTAVNPASRTRSLARAEIQTHSNSIHLLPSSIYLSRQVDFFAFRAIDEYTPLSVIDIEARTRRLIYRPEVEAKPFSPDILSFDEPLLNAMHSLIEERPRPQIPGLPNGQPSRRWPASIPIRSVTAGLGEGVDRVKREYVRAQNIRTKRRLRHESERASNSLSFEDDAVFPSMSLAFHTDADLDVDADDLDSASSPSSGLLPASLGNTEPSEDDEWSAEWEEEYRKAVEDDGPPDELVLGLMDEEEEERRKWEMRRERLKREYADGKR